MQVKNYSKSTVAAILGVCTALVALGTFLIKIPVTSGGYVNAGDALIFLFASLFGPLCGLVCGALGSALADILSGYIIYAPFTLVIKGLEGLICGLLVSAFTKKHSGKSRYLPLCIAAALISSAVMIIGYYFAAAIILSNMHSALVTIAENSVQAGVCTAIYILLLAALKHKKRDDSIPF